MSNISPTSFVTGPKDEVAATDIYEKVDISKPINRITETIKGTAGDAVAEASEVAKGVVDSAKDSLKSLTDPRNIVKAIKAGEIDKSLLKGLPTSKEEALGLIKGIGDKAIGNINALQNLKGEFLTDILTAVGFKENAGELAKGILGLPGSTTPINTLLNSNPKLKIIYDGAEFIRDNKDKDTATGVASMLNAITGNSELAKVIDMETQFSVINNVLQKSYEYNIPGIADAFIDGAPTNKEKAQIALNISKVAFPNANLQQIQLILNNAPPEQILAQYPTCINDLLSNYKLPIPEDGETIDLPAKYTELLAVLNSTDPNWNQVLRNGTYIDNLDPYMNCSEDARKVLSTDTMHRTLLLIASNYNVVDLVADAKKAYPKAAI